VKEQRQLCVSGSPVNGSNFNSVDEVSSFTSSPTEQEQSNSLASLTAFEVPATDLSFGNNEVSVTKL